MVVPPPFTFVYYYPFDPDNPQGQFDNPGNLEDSGLLYNFDVDEAALETGMGLMAWVALKEMEKKLKSE